MQSYKMNIKSAQYIKNTESNICGVKVTLANNEIIYVSRSLENSDYAEILKQVKEGTLTIKDAD